MEKKIKKIIVERKDLLLKSVNSDELSENKYRHSSSEFDEEGNLIEEISFNRDDKPEQIQRFMYGLNNKLMEEQTLEADMDVVERKTYEYGEGDRLLKSYIHYTDGSFDTLTWFYNAQGLVEKKELVDADGVLENTELFEYQGDKVIRHAVYDADEEMLYEKTQVFDENGNVVETIEEDFETGTYMKKVNEYDNDGHRLESLTYNENDDLIARVVFFYDESGNMTEVVDEDQRGKNNIRMEYDERGNVIFQEEKNKDGFLTSRVERVFDEDNRSLESHVFSSRLGLGPDLNYVLTYVYEFY